MADTEEPILCSLYCDGTIAMGVVLIEFGMMDIPLPVCEGCYVKIHEGIDPPGVKDD
jgi:hypothetical protein